MNSDKNTYFNSSLAKGLEILELLIEKEELNVSEVARILNQNRTTCHRLLSTLHDLAYVEKQGQKYKPTLKILQKASVLSSRYEITRLSDPFMHSLSQKYQETIFLGTLHGTEVLCLSRLDSTELLRIDPRIGLSAPIYCTSLGKTLLAFMDDTKMQSAIEKLTIQQHTNNTVANHDELRKELAKVRKQGFAMDNEEFYEGLTCVAAPILNKDGNADYAISVSGPTARMHGKQLDDIRKEVINACQAISKQLSYLN